MSIGHSLSGTPESIIPGGQSANAPIDIHPALDHVRGLAEFAPPRPDWLGDILQNPLIKSAAENLERTLQSFLNAVGQLISRIRPPALEHLPENILNLFSGFVGFLVVLVLLYIFYLFLGWLMARQERTRKPQPAAARQVDGTLLVNPAHHQQEAQTHAQAGRYNAALRELYLSSLCLLDQSAVVPFAPTRTNRGYMSALLEVPNQSVRPAFAHLATAFEAARYGGQPVDAGTYSECADRYQRLSQWAQGLGAHV